MSSSCEDLERIISSLPKNSLRVSIFGSVEFNHKDSPALCAAIGRRLATIQPSITLFTGANAVVHESITLAFCDADPARANSVFHLKPKSMGACPFRMGTLIIAGVDWEERRQLLAQAGHVAISVEGGPGTADEMRRAHAAGRTIIPISRSGGASSGMFGTTMPSIPPGVKPSDWALLADCSASPEDTAAAVVAILEVVQAHILSPDGGCT